jgi:hypothetical protein
MLVIIGVHIHSYRPWNLGETCVVWASLLRPLSTFTSTISYTSTLYESSQFLLQLSLSSSFLQVVDAPQIIYDIPGLPKVDLSTRYECRDQEMAHSLYILLAEGSSS